MDERPLIAVFCNSFPPEIGGASGRIYNLAIILRDAGYRVQVVCAMPNYPTGKIFRAYRGRLVSNEVIDGIQVKRVWLIPSNASSAFRRGGSIFSFVLSLRALAYRGIFRRRPSLVFVSSPPLPMAADVARFFSRRGIKVLLNISDIWPLSAAALGTSSNHILYRLLQKIERTLYSRADAFTGQSEEILRHIAALEPMAKPVLLYRNLPAADKPVIGYPARPVRIIYPGMLGHAQGVFALCRSIDFAALSVSLHIYGEGAEQALISAWIAAHPGCGVQLHEPVPPDMLTDLLSGFHAMLIPLVAPIEGAVPSKLFTAVQSGLPVLYSGGGEGAELVDKYQLGWTAAPGDYTSIIEHIIALTKLSNGEYEALRKHIADVGKTSFNKAAQDIRFLRFIENLLITP